MTGRGRRRGEAARPGGEAGDRIVLKLRFPPVAERSPPDWQELLDRLDRLERRPVRRAKPST